MAAQYAVIPGALSEMPWLQGARDGMPGVVGALTTERTRELADL